MDERDRRHSRQFEPPPWEQEAFESFRQKQRECEQEAELEAALIQVRQASEESVPDKAATDAEELIAADKVVESGAKKDPDAALAVDPAELQTMLIGLRQEEPPVKNSYKLIANGVSALLVASGIGFVVWAAVLFSKVGSDQGPMPTLASMLLMVWGFMLIGGAALLFKKYNL